ncbi:MAG: hypothetical protein VCE12_04510 [Candidatus Latescibacterota bacterium]
MPQREGYESLLTRADEVLLVRLAAFLWLAEFLDAAAQPPWTTSSSAGTTTCLPHTNRRAILDTIAEAPVES